MADERLELVLKAARKVEELRAERGRLVAEIDQKIRSAEAELGGMIGTGSALLKEIERHQAERFAVLDAEVSAELAKLRDMSLQDRLIEAIRLAPRASVAGLAAAIYDGDTGDQARHRIRSMLWTLKKKGRIRETETGHEVLK